ncbi:MAG: hypothetical protein ACI4CS_07050, partial [Candidatus Weimeria sp.]
MSMISDNFEKTGTDFAEFKAALTDFASATECDLINSDEITFYSLIENDKVKERIEAKKPGILDGKVPFYVLDKKALEENNEEGKSFPVGLVSEDCFLPEQW